ncbi:uncharacterized protein LOC124495158 [Dermatophagoides farinae]|uniref:Cytochrome c oxidase polypeptide VIIc n=1 Tax=Dermatophagoides farinae TaxID=6954 RepID=A0A922HVM3_DERFA|nr:uncharacterized protein LOC124495158 [Dermatophagoides farinae]KAH7637340.1 hypothetical protein HUG17_7546 [Dermatophagoides farinae]KAH9511230.1 hypothetical protein DERF_009702 [Dermatophagoides farinae]
MISSRVLNLIPKSVMRQSLARSHDHKEIVYKGANFPFDTYNSRSLAIKMIIFFSIPYSIPYLVWRRRLARNKGI